MPFRIGGLDRLLGPASASVLQRRRDVRFECLTEEWRIAATIQGDPGLAEALNRRDPVSISDVLWGPVDGSSPLRPAPMLRNLDPYDLVVAMAGDECPPILSEADRAAFRNSRIAYDVVLDAAPFRLSGTLFLLPGREPGSLLERGAALFFPLTRPVIHLGEMHVRNAPIDAVLVNRSYVHDVVPARSPATEAIRRAAAAPRVAASGATQREPGPVAGEAGATRTGRRSVRPVRPRTGRATGGGGRPALGGDGA